MVEPTVCPTVEDPDLVLQEAGYPKSLIYSRPAECGIRQAIQAESDHSNKIISLPEVF